MGTDVERMAAGKYVLLTTFRKSGAAVPTPLWVVRDGDELVVWTPVNTGKIKRLRNNREVEVAACDFRGNPSGPVLKGTARVLPGADAARVRRMIRSKYGPLGWVTVTGSVVRRGRSGTIGIAIALTE
jgi:PPOX class probable F420-dependent enzyme